MATRKGHPMSAATKAKIAAALKGKHHGGAKKGSHHKGHPLSATARAKISAALKGKHRPKTAKQLAAARASLAKARAAQKGKPRTAAQLAAARANLAKARAAEKGRPKTAKQLAAAKANLAKARAASAAKRRGRPLSASTRAKISASLLRRHGRTVPLRPRGRPGTHANGLHHALHGHRLHAGAGRHRYRHSRKSLISAHTRRNLRGLLHTRTRHHRHRPVLRRTVRAHRVWRRRRRR